MITLVPSRFCLLACFDDQLVICLVAYYDQSLIITGPIWVVKPFLPLRRLVKNFIEVCIGIRPVGVAVAFEYGSLKKPEEVVKCVEDVCTMAIVGCVTVC